MSETTLSKWKKSRVHEVTLPSGFQVKIIIPNLPQLIKAGQLSNELINAALGATQGDEKITRETIEQQADVYNKLVSITVKEPTVTEEDVAELPYEDVEMIVELATRQRDIDAVGHHIGGLEKIEEFRKFRSLGFSSEDIPGL